MMSCGSAMQGGGLPLPCFWEQGKFIFQRSFSGYFIKYYSDFLFPDNFEFFALFCIILYNGISKAWKSIPKFTKEISQKSFGKNDLTGKNIR